MLLTTASRPVSGSFIHGRAAETPATATAAAVKTEDSIVGFLFSFFLLQKFAVARVNEER